MTDGPNATECRINVNNGEVCRVQCEPIKNVLTCTQECLKSVLSDEHCAESNTSLFVNFCCIVSYCNTLLKNESNILPSPTQTLTQTLEPSGK